MSSYIRSQKKTLFQGRSTEGNNGSAAHVRTARWLASGSHAAFQTYLTMIEVCCIQHFDTSVKCYRKQNVRFFHSPAVQPWARKLLMQPGFSDKIRRFMILFRFSSRQCFISYLPHQTVTLKISRSLIVTNTGRQ